MEMSAGTAPVTWAVPYPCQNRRKTTVASGHPRTPLTASELGTRRSTPCAKRPSKQRVMQLDWGHARATCGRDERVMVGTHGQSSDALPG